MQAITQLASLLIEPANLRPEVMKNILLLFFLFALPNCNSTEVNSKTSTNTSSVADTSTVKSDEISSPALNCDGILYNYFINKDKYIYKKWELPTGINLIWVQFEKIMEIEECIYDDPFHNVVMAVLPDKNELIKLLHFSSVEMHDFSFKQSVREDTVFIFEYYSSPVGYTELTIYESSQNNWYKTDKMDELGEISSIISVDFINKEVIFALKDGQIFNKNIFLYGGG